MWGNPLVKITCRDTIGGSTWRINEEWQRQFGNSVGFCNRIRSAYTNGSLRYNYSRKDVRDIWNVDIIGFGWSEM